MQSFEVARAGVEDADTVGELLAAFNSEFDDPSTDAAAFAARFRRLLARDDVLVLLARRPEVPAADGAAAFEPVGFAFLTLRPTPYYDGPLAQLEELYVVPALRDRGIGTALLLTAVETVVGLGAGEMHINVDEADVHTRRFYQRHGFVNIEPGNDYRMLCYLREL